MTSPSVRPYRLCGGGEGRVGKGHLKVTRTGELKNTIFSWRDLRKNSFLFVMSTNDSRVFKRKKRKRQRARMNKQRSSEEVRERERVKARERTRNSTKKRRE